MEKNLRIIEFLDGGLESNKEDALFRELANDEELRSELKNQIKIERALNRRMSDFMPSAKSTIKVFSNLGYIAPARLAQKYAGIAGLLAFLLDFMRNNSRVILGSLLMTMITSGLFLLFYHPSPEKIIQYEKVQVPVPSPPAINPSNKISGMQDKNFKQNKNNNIHKAIVLGNNNVQSINKESAVGAHSNQIENISKNVNSNNNPNENTIFQDKQISSNPNNSQIINSPLNNIGESLLSKSNKDYINHIIENNLPAFNLINNFPLYDLNLAPRGLSGINLSIRGIPADYSFPSVIMSKQYSYHIFNNYGIALAYQLDKDFEIGFDLRQERFAQKFQGVENGVQWEYKQYPYYGALTLLLKYRLINWNILSLYSNLMIGGVQTGYLGRIGLEMEYEPIDNYIIFGGIEGGYLIYNHQGTFNTSKADFNWGVKFRF